MKKKITPKVFAIAALRRSSYRWIPRESARRLAKVDRNQYKCKTCGGIFKRKDTKIDHINPVVPVETGWAGFDSFIERLFCQIEGFQILCCVCHKEKTKIEGDQRKLLRKK